MADRVMAEVIRRLGREGFVGEQGAGVGSADAIRNPQARLQAFDARRRGTLTRGGKAVDGITIYR